MGIWDLFFGKRKKTQELSREESREGFGPNDQRVSCMDVVRIIQQSVDEFKQSSGMVVVLLEGLRVQIFLFDGIERTNWGYNSGQFTTDKIGQTFLVGPPIVLALGMNVNAETLLPQLLKREFADCDMIIGHLWKLDPNAWDYEAMKSLHGDDVGIRISFTCLHTKKFQRNSPTLQANNEKIVELLVQSSDLTTKGENGKARDLLNDALTLSKINNDLLGKGNVLRAIGFLDCLDGDFDKAKNLNFEAISLFRQGGYKAQEAFALMGLGNIEKGMGNRGVAKQHFQQAAKLYGDLNMTLDMEMAIAKIDAH